MGRLNRFPPQWRRQGDIRLGTRGRLLRLPGKWRALLSERRRISGCTTHERRSLLATQQENQRHDRNSNRNPDGLPIRFTTALLFDLALAQPFPFTLFFVKGPRGLCESVNGIFFIQPKRPRIGPHEPTGEDLIRQFGEVALLKCLDEVRPDAGLRSDFVDR